MKKVYMLVVALALINATIFSQTQTIVNLNWQQETGLPSEDFDYSTSKRDANGDLLTIGNTYNESDENYNFLIHKQDSETGEPIWSVEWDSTNDMDDYATALWVTNDAIYVCGAAKFSSTATNWIVLKLDASDGSIIWTYVHSDYYAISAAPADIMVYDDDVFVTGAVLKGTTSSNYLTMSLDKDSGNSNWSQEYDYDNVYDAGIKMTADTGYVFVTGVSGSEWEDAQITTLRYDASDGSDGTVHTLYNATDYIDVPTDMVRTNSGDLFIVGNVGTQNNGTDIKLIKLNSSLEVIWTSTKDGYGNNDFVHSLAVDDANNCYLTGYMLNDDGKKEIFLLKYGSTGSLVWEKRKASPYTGDAIGWDVAANESMVYVTGEYFMDDQKDVVTLAYTNNGAQKMMQIKDGGYDGNDCGRAIEIGDNNNLFVYGKMSGTGFTRYFSLEYELWARERSVENNQAGFNHMNNELIVRFDPAVVNTTWVDNKNLLFETLENVIDQSTVTLMSDAAGEDIRTTHIKKIVTRMTSQHTTSITRQGDTIQISEYWAILSLEVPDGVDLDEFKTNLDSLEEVYYTDYNLIGEYTDIPDDAYVSSYQESLIPSTELPNASIHANEAWDIETGKNYVKVGVVDKPIYWQHPEFGDGTIAGSKVTGWVYNENGGQEIFEVDPTGMHGTACAGIIGALRNNGIGVAGIAGGDIDDGNTGVQIWSLGNEEGDGPSLEYTISALIEGSTDSDDFGFGLHIFSNSYVFADGYPSTIPSLSDAVKSCWRNQCPFIAGRGNFGTDATLYPACFTDSWTMCVGASGTNGLYKFEDTNGEGGWSSSYGGPLDFVAPGVKDIITTTMAPVESTTDCDFSNTEYSCFGGTSAAAPHVAGVAALMYSYFNVNNGMNFNLAPEDVENLIEYHANELDATPGYDAYNGHGLVDASAAMQGFAEGQYTLVHANGNADVEVVPFPTQQIILGEAINGLAAGNYFAEKFRVDQVKAVIWLDAGAQTLAVWKRESAGRGYGANNPVYDNTFCNIFELNTENGDAYIGYSTWCWHVVADSEGSTLDVWLPTTPGNLNIPMSVYTEHAVGVDEIEVASSTLHLFPNPANDEISFTLPSKHEYFNCQIVDAMGKVVMEEKITSQSTAQAKIDVIQLAKGTYTVRVVSDSIVMSETFVKL